MELNFVIIIKPKFYIVKNIHYFFLKCAVRLLLPMLSAFYPAFKFYKIQ
jgi:hypothetical protein